MSLGQAAKWMRSRTFGRPAGTSTARSPAWSAVHDRPLACPQDRRRALFRQRRGLGFHPHNHLLAFMIPRGIRLNNPGNIEHGAPWEGLDPRNRYPRFCGFVSSEYGLRDIVRVLVTYYDERRERDGWRRWEERRVGQGGVLTGRSRGGRAHI